MALHSFAVVVVVLVSCLLASPAIMVSSINISTYWGTNYTEGSIIDACNTGSYGILNIGFVDRFGHHLQPRLNISGHCQPSVGGCKYLGSEIIKCQNNGIKVLLSIGGPGGNYILSDASEATELANYLWNNYLGGESSDRPFGDNATLDGIDFFIEAGTTQYWDVLAQALRDLSNINGTQMELSATPKCQFPDHYLGAAIQTGLFDYVQVRFYNESACEYNGSFEAMNSSWNVWTADDQVHKVYVGVTAFTDEEGYVPPKVLVDGFLQYAADSPKFGGLMVWNYYADRNYSREFKYLNSAIQTTPSPSGVEVE